MILHALLGHASLREVCRERKGGQEESVSALLYVAIRERSLTFCHPVRDASRDKTCGKGTHRRLGGRDRGWLVQVCKEACHRRVSGKGASICVSEDNPYEDELSGFGVVRTVQGHKHKVVYQRTCEGKLLLDVRVSFSSSHASVSSSLPRRPQSSPLSYTGASHKMVIVVQSACGTQSSALPKLRAQCRVAGIEGSARTTVDLRLV